MMETLSFVSVDVKSRALLFNIYRLVITGIVFLSWSFTWLLCFSLNVTKRTGLKPMWPTSSHGLCLTVWVQVLYDPLHCLERLRGTSNKMSTIGEQGRPSNTFDLLKFLLAYLRGSFPPTYRASDELLWCWPQRLSFLTASWVTVCKSALLWMSSSILAQKHSCTCRLLFRVHLSFREACGQQRPAHWAAPPGSAYSHRKSSWVCVLIDWGVSRGGDAAGTRRCSQSCPSHSHRWLTLIRGSICLLMESYSEACQLEFPLIFNQAQRGQTW